MTNPVGRPPITTKDLPDDWKESVTILAKEGASIVELSAELGISRDTFYRLSKDDQEFADTVKRCKELSEVWWERQGRTALRDKEFSYVGWYMNMKNRFGWRDKHEFSGDKKQPLIVDILGNDNSKPETKEPDPNSQG